MSTTARHAAHRYNWGPSAINTMIVLAALTIGGGLGFWLSVAALNAGDIAETIRSIARGADVVAIAAVLIYMTRCAVGLYRLRGES